MTGLQSLWTRTHKWKPTRTALLLHTLSHCFLRVQFDHTELVTDECGLLIADRLRWKYDSYRTDLTFIPADLRHIWAAGKLFAQRSQTKPYAHVDNDFLLQDRLPVNVRNARVFIQGKDEPGYYLTKNLQAMLELAEIPKGVCAYNAGIVGGSDIPLLHAYADYGLKLVQALKAQTNGTVISIVAEQASFGHFLRHNEVPIVELIPIPNSTIRSDFKDCRFSHLWAWTKEEKRWATQIETMLKEKFPDAYEEFNRGFPHLDRVLNHPRRRNCYS